MTAAANLPYFARGNARLHVDLGQYLQIVSLCHGQVLFAPRCCSVVHDCSCEATPVVWWEDAWAIHPFQPGHMTINIRKAPRPRQIEAGSALLQQSVLEPSCLHPFAATCCGCVSIRIIHGEYLRWQIKGRVYQDSTSRPRVLSNLANLENNFGTTRVQ